MPKVSELQSATRANLSLLDQIYLVDRDSEGTLFSRKLSIDELTKYFKENAILSGNSFPSSPLTNQYFNLLQDTTLSGTDYKAGLYFYNANWQNVFTAGNDARNEFDTVLNASGLPSSPNDLDIVFVEADFTSLNQNNASFSFEEGFFYKYSTSSNPAGWYKVGTEPLVFRKNLPDQLEIIKASIAPSSASDKLKIWWNTTGRTLNYWNGNAWISFFDASNFSSQKFDVADTLNDLPANSSAGDKLLVTNGFTQRRTRPSGAVRDYVFRKGIIYRYYVVDTPNNLEAGFFSESERPVAFTEDLPTVPTTSAIATALNALTGTSRVDYTSLKNTPTIPVVPSTSTIATALNALTGDSRLSYNSLKDTPTIPSVMNLTATNLKQNMTETEKNSFNSVIGSLRKVGNTDLKVLDNAQQLDFQRQIGVENSPPPETVLSASELVPNLENPFKLGQLKLMQTRFSIPKSEFGSANLNKDIDLTNFSSVFDSADIECIIGSPSRIYLKDISSNNFRSIIITQDVNGNDTFGFRNSEDIILDTSKNPTPLRGCNVGSSRICVVDDGVPSRVQVYYTHSTKPAGATTNWEREIRVFGGFSGNLKGVCVDEERDILYVVPSASDSVSWSTVFAYRFSTGARLLSHDINISQSRISDMKFSNDCLLLQDRIGEQVYVYDSITKQYSSKVSFPLRSNDDEYNSMVLYENTLYSYVYDSDYLYSFKTGYFQGAYSEAELGRAILEYSPTGFIPVFNAGQKTTSSEIAPTTNVEDTDIWIDNSEIDSLKTYYRKNSRWIALSPDRKLKTLGPDMTDVERRSAQKKLGVNGEYTYSDNADNLEYNRSYFLSETASKTPVSNKRFFITTSGRKQIAISLDDGSSYYRLENESYTNYGQASAQVISLVQRFSNSEIRQDTIKRFLRITTGAPFGQNGLIYGTRLVVDDEVRFYQVALTKDRMFYRYSTDTTALTNATWIEGEPDELFIEDVSLIPNFNNQIWILKKGDHGDSTNAGTNFLRTFQRTISGSIIKETISYPTETDSVTTSKIFQLSRIKSERFLLSEWIKDYGQMVPSPSNHPPDTDRVWYDTGSKELKRFYTETATRGVRNEETEFTVDITGVLGGFLKDDSNRLYYFSTASGANRNLRAYTFLGQRDSTKDINIGLQNNSFLCTGGAFDSLNQRVLVVDGNNLSTTRRVYAYSPIDQSYVSAGNIQLHGITRYNLFYGGFALRSVGETNRVGTAGALGSMNGLAYRASTDQLLSISNSARNIFVVNQTTGVALRVGNAGAIADSGGFYSLAVVNDIIYTINSTTNTLMRVSEVDGSGTIVKQSGLPARSWASLTGHKNLLYAISNSDNGLYEISPSEGTGRLIGILPPGDWEALGSDGENLFAINSTDDQLYIVSDVNGSANLVSEESFLVSGRYTGLTYKPSIKKFFTNNGTSLYEVDTSTIAKLYLLGRHTGDSTRHEIVVFSLNSETYGQQLTDETIVLSGATNPTAIASNGEHIHVLDTVSNVDGIKGYTFAGARDSSKDITLHADNNTNATGIIFNEGLVNVFDTTNNDRKVFSYTDSNTISFWDSVTGPRSIREDQLKVRIVGSDILKLNAVINENLAENSVATRNIQNGNVTNAKIGNNSINHRTMATNAIENENILNGTVGLEKLAVDGFPRSAIGITDDGQSLAYRHFPYLDKRTIEELPDIDSNDRDFYIPVLAGPSFTHGSTVSSASTSVQGFHQALAIDRNGTIAEFWRTSNATGQGHIRLSSIRGGGHADHTVSSFNSSTNIHMQSDGDYWWMMEFSNNELRLHRLNSKAFYPLNSYIFSSALRNSTFGSDINNFRGFSFMTPNTIIDGHGFTEIVIAGPNTAWIFSFNTTNGFGASQHTISLESLANITDCQGVAVAGRGHSHMYFVDSPSTEECKAFSTLDNSRVSGLDFTFSNAGTTRVALAGYRDFLLNSWTNNNLSTGQVDGDQVVKKLRVNGNNKLIRTNSSGALVLGDIS